MIDRHISTRIQVIEAPCPLCGSPEKQIVKKSLLDVECRLPGAYDIAQCSKCRMVYLSRKPSSAFLPSCYDYGYHTHQDSRRNALVRILFEIRFTMWKSEIEKFLPSQGGDILELGCGDGQYIQFLERCFSNRYQWTALDFNVDYIRLPSSSKIKLLSGSIDEFRSDKQFDLVIMQDTLEHLPNPLLALQRVAALLKKGGVFVGQLPGWDSPWRRTFPRHWGGLQAPRHQTFFTADTLGRVLNVAGFDDVTIHYTFDPGDLGVSVCNWMTELMRLKTPPRQAWFYLPIILLSAPIVFLQTVLLRGKGALSFAARKSCASRF